jgi:hypothetical protein
MSWTLINFSIDLRLREALRQRIDLLVGLFYLHLVVIVLLLVALDLLRRFTLRLIERNVEILDLLG